MIWTNVTSRRLSLKNVLVREVVGAPTAINNHAPTSTLKIVILFSISVSIIPTFCLCCETCRLAPSEWQHAQTSAPMRGIKNIRNKRSGGPTASLLDPIETLIYERWLLAEAYPKKQHEQNPRSGVTTRLRTQTRL